MKTVDYTLIEKYYDERLSIQGNLEQLKAKGIEVGKTSLYNYCKNKGISDRLGEDELRTPNKSYADSKTEPRPIERERL